ncbi:MAG: hypothetical protein HFI03_10055 [Lachnospiraceae bacterium]|nr:hypothetical protein [Lachnospiraceae bacterium]
MIFPDGVAAGPMGCFIRIGLSISLDMHRMIILTSIRDERRQAPQGSPLGPDTGERITAYLFAAAMPYSQIGYVGAAASMDGKVWLPCHVDMFHFLAEHR